ncbi:hypothetical protein AB0J80_27785 [Actinoplanes sp. NPDC049548]|uniref:hypothetical protein n=1 Tax=Actinoplanes sp. NPDC049548 TaxID=3155152 RepID=UPI00341336E7
MNSVADRLLEKVAPAVTADAACVYLSTETWFVGDPNCSSGIRVETVKHYDNCPPKKTARCWG